MSMSMIKGLIAHEIGTHGLRKKNGQQSKVLLLSSGLDRYEQGEEGLATFREQAETPTADYAGLEAYFAIGIAKGMDGGSKRNFAQVFEILTNYYLISENTDTARAKELAWSRCERIFRGTTGTVPGVVFSKDLMYREGNISHWKAVANGALDGLDLDSGKFDPTNPRHVNFLNNLKELNQKVDQLQ
ncbi:flavohemoglobin expression-modulating QEGLA motif protein [Patescibacteria group bacterium]|nr:flavohemoglobin expression-modulating QEGLA motif protein [Patescibacteria group bacterium]